jgi:hypothetical protein
MIFVALPLRDLTSLFVLLFIPNLMRNIIHAIPVPILSGAQFTVIKGFAQVSCKGLD